MKKVLLLMVIGLFCAWGFATAYHTIDTSNTDLTEFASDELIQTDDNGNSLYVTWDANNIYIGLHGMILSSNDERVEIFVRGANVTDEGASNTAQNSWWGEDTNISFSYNKPVREFSRDGDDGGGWLGAGEYDDANGWHALGDTSKHDWAWADYGTTDKAANGDMKFAFSYSDLGMNAGDGFYLVVLKNDKSTNTMSIVFPKENGTSGAITKSFYFSNTNDGQSPNTVCSLGVGDWQLY